jgi:hypothetical protein
MLLGKENRLSQQPVCYSAKLNGPAPLNYTNQDHDNRQDEKNVNKST